MPSWKFHEKWAKKLDLKYSPDVDKIIDKLDLHDKGRRSKIKWLMPNLGIMIESGISVMYFELAKVYGYPVPKDVLKTAMLHHLLDVYEKRCRDIGIKIVEFYSETTLLRYAADTLFKNIERQCKYASDLYPVYLYGKKKNYLEEACDALDEVINDIIDRNLVKELKDDMIKHIREKTKSDKDLLPIGPLGLCEVLRDILSHGIIEVNSQPLPIASACKKIISELSKNNKVKIELSTKKGRKTIIARNIDELLKEISKLLN